MKAKKGKNQSIMVYGEGREFENLTYDTWVEYEEIIARCDKTLAIKC